MTGKISVYLKVPMEKRFAANVPVPSGVKALTWVPIRISSHAGCTLYTVVYKY